MARRARGLELAVMAFAGFAGILDTSFLIPIISLYAIHLGASGAVAGFIAGLYSMVAIPASVVAGILVDRLGRKRMLFLGLLLDSISMLLYALASSVTQLALVRALHAIGGSLVFPAFLARSREVSGERIGFGLGLMLAPVALAIAIGSGFSGVTTALLGYRIPFIVIALVLGIASLLTLTLPPRPEERAWKGLKGIREGLAEAGSSVLAGLWVITMLYVALGIIVGGLGASLVKAGLMEERTARLAMGVSVALSSFIAAVLFIINGIIADRWGVALIVGYSSLVGLLGFLVASWNPGAPTIIAGVGVFGVSLSGLMLASTILVSNAPPKARGTAIGLQQVFNILGVAIGAPLGGILAGVGPEGVMLSAGLFTFLALAAVPYARS